LFNKKETNNLKSNGNLNFRTVSNNDLRKKSILLDRKSSLRNNYFGKFNPTLRDTVINNMAENAGVNQIFNENDLNKIKNENIEKIVEEKYPKNLYDTNTNY